MAKLSREDRRAHIAEREEIQEIRRRYAEALRMGYSTEKAAEFAHGYGEISPVNVQKPASSSGTNPLPHVQKISVHGGGQEPQESMASGKLEIPPNWQDLPWPQLKSLADQLHGSDVKSRKLAYEVIGKAVQNQ